MKKVKLSQKKQNSRKPDDKSPSSSKEDKLIIEHLREKISSIAEKDPEKAAIIISQWINEDAKSKKKIA